jgi:hypothetical protein
MRFENGLSYNNISLNGEYGGEKIEIVLVWKNVFGGRGGELTEINVALACAQTAPATLFRFHQDIILIVFQHSVVNPFLINSIFFIFLLIFWKGICIKFVVNKV